MLAEIQITGGPTGSTVEVKQDGVKLESISRIQLEVEPGGLVAAALFVSPLWLNLNTRFYDVVGDRAIELAKHLARELGVPDMERRIYEVIISYKVNRDDSN